MILTKHIHTLRRAAATATGACALFVMLGVVQGGCAASGGDGVVRVAVASNFTSVQETLAARFTAETGIPVESSYGATGALYSQIAHGAPFAILLAADAERPARLETEGAAVAGSRFTYALGALVLFGPDGTEAGAGALRAGAFTRLAICKPELAPYGAAARQTLERLVGWDAVAPKLVLGDNVTQTYQFVATGNAELGFVALSQVLDRPASHYWRVPDDLHDPIRQDAVLLRAGAGSDGARRYLAFLQSPEARGIIEAAGYRVPEPAR